MKTTNPQNEAAVIQERARYFYKGPGEHSVSALETMVEERNEALIELRGELQELHRKFQEYVQSKIDLYESEQSDAIRLREELK